jgi:hypothetical protein
MPSTVADLGDPDRSGSKKAVKSSASTRKSRIAFKQTQRGGRGKLLASAGHWTKYSRVPVAAGIFHF